MTSYGPRCKRCGCVLNYNSEYCSLCTDDRNIHMDWARVAKCFPPINITYPPSTNSTQSPEASENLYVECGCGDFNHLIIFSYDKSDQYDQPTVGVSMNYYFGFLKRIWNAIKYVFGSKCRYGNWDTTLIEVDKAEKIISLLKEYVNNKTKEEQRSNKVSSAKS